MAASLMLLFSLLVTLPQTAADMMGPASTDSYTTSRYLSYTLNSTLIRKQDATSIITSIAANRDGQDLAWDFMREQWDYMFTQYGVGSFSFAALISGVTARFSTPTDLQQLQDFVDSRGGPGGFGPAALAVDQALERTAANIKWVQRNKQEVLDWVRSHTGPGSG